MAKTIKDVDNDTIVVAAGYADAHRVGAVDPMEIPKVAKELDATWLCLILLLKMVIHYLII